AVGGDVVVWGGGLDAAVDRAVLRNADDPLVAVQRLFAGEHVLCAADGDAGPAGLWGAAQRDAQVHGAAAAPLGLHTLQVHGDQVGGAGLGPEGAVGETALLGHRERDVIHGGD